MPRPRTKAEDIRNPEHYFNRYIALEVKNDQAKQQVISENEVSLEEKMERKSFHINVAVNTSGNMLLHAVIEKEPDGWIDTLKSESLSEALRTLTPCQREIIRLHYFDGLKMAEISAALGVSKSAVTQRHQGAIKTLKDFFSAP